MIPTWWRILITQRYRRQSCLDCLPSLFLSISRPPLLIQELPLFLGSNGKESACNTGDPGFKKVMETHSSILAWRIPWTEEPGSYSPEGCTESDGKESTCNTGDPGLKKVMETHSSILAWRIPWTEGPGSYSPEGCTESDMTEAT